VIKVFDPEKQCVDERIGPCLCSRLLPHTKVWV